MYVPLPRTLALRCPLHPSLSPRPAPPLTAVLSHAQYFRIDATKFARRCFTLLDTDNTGEIQVTKEERGRVCVTGESSDDRKCARNKDDERLHDQPLLKVSVWRDSPAGGRVLDFALLFKGGTAVTRDSETFPR